MQTDQPTDRYIMDRTDSREIDQEKNKFKCAPSSHTLLADKYLITENEPYNKGK